MNSLLIASFKDESPARNAMKKLDNLALNGEIDLYERTLVRKALGGRCELYKDSGSSGWQTITGALAGGLVGLPGGPVGFVIGLLSGAVVGSTISDREQRSFGEEIVARVENDIPPGKVAIVAHIGERGPELIDSMLKGFDSFALRSDLRNTRENNYEII
jgi:uncharacterized membrane protein